MKNVNVKNVLFKPSVDLKVETIMNKSFAGVYSTPKIYSIEPENMSDIILNDTIRFKFDDITSELNICDIHFVDDPKIVLVECSYWKEIYN